MFRKILVPLDGSKVGEAAMPVIDTLISQTRPEVETEVTLIQAIPTSHWIAAGDAGAPAEETLGGIRVLRVGGRYDFNIVLPFALRRRTREESFDVVVEVLNKIPLCTPVFLRILSAACAKSPERRPAGSEASCEIGGMA